MEFKIIIILALTLITLLLITSNKLKLYSNIPALLLIVTSVLQYLVRWEFFYLFYSFIVFIIVIKINVSAFKSKSLFQQLSFKVHGLTARLTCVEFTVTDDKDGKVLFDMYNNGHYEVMRVRVRRGSKIEEQSIKAIEKQLGIKCKKH